MEILDVLKKFKMLGGYLGAGVFSPSNEMIGGISNGTALDFEVTGTLLHDAYTIFRNYSFEGGYGNVNSIRVDTDKVVIFITSYARDRIFFRLLLVVDQREDLALTKQLMDEVEQDLARFFQKNL